jgi:hypothetical protein
MRNLVVGLSVVVEKKKKSGRLQGREGSRKVTILAEIYSL